MSRGVRITVLGCGHSAGTPLVGNDWRACDPAEPKNRRTRVSVYVQGEEGAFMVDTSPDFREQVNANHINRIEAVVYTHCHSDHVNGIDDLRHWCKYRNLTDFPVYMTQETARGMFHRYDYLLVKQPDEFYPLLMKPHILPPEDLYVPLAIGGVPGVTLFEQDHKTCTSLGVRVGNFAYSTDMLNLSDQSIAALQGIETWVVDGASYKGTPYVHANLEIVYALNQRVGARQVYITHMPPNMDYQTLCRELPPGYAPAYDGLQIEAMV